MWNPFKKKSKASRELRSLSTAFALVNELNRRGLIHWQVKDKMLLIEESLAVSTMAHGEQALKNLLDNVAAWQNFRLIRDDYEALRIKTEAEAVRKAQEKYPNIDADDIRRIRQEARTAMPMIDPDKHNTIHEFDILIIRASAPSWKNATEAGGNLLALGHYDGRQVEMAMYDDVKDILKKETDR